MTNPQQSTPRDWATRLIDWRIGLFALAVVITVMSWGPATRLKSDQSVEALFAKSDPRVLALRRSKALFGGDELAFFCYTDPNLNTPEGMNRLRDLSQSLGEVPGILTASVQDLATSLDQARLPFINIPPDKFRELTHRVLIGDDGITTAIVLRFAPLDPDDVAIGDKRAQVELSPVPRVQTVRQIREVAAAFTLKSGLSTHMVGEPVQELDALQYVEADDLWLGNYSAGLLLLLLLILFRNLRWMLVPVAIAFVALVWTRAILTCCGVRLGMVSSMLTPMLTMIGVALTVPIAVGFRQRRLLADPRTSLAASIRELGPAYFAVVMISAIGSAALLTSEIYPLAEFGWMIAIGTLLLIPAVASLLPLATLCGARTLEVRLPRAASAMETALQRMVRGVEGAPVAITVFTLGLAGLALVGCSRVQIETDFIKNFRPSSPIAIGLDFVERHFGGSATWEVNFPTPEEMTEEFLVKVEKLAVELRQLQVRGRPGLTKVICLADGEAIVPRTFFTSELSRRLWLLDKLQAEYVSTLYNADEKRMRLILRSLERQSSQEKLEIIRRALETTRQHFPEAEATGIFVVLTFLIEDLLRDQWISLAAAAGAIFLVVGIAFRKLSFGLICLIPSLFSLILVLGTMGWLGLRINIASAMVASMSLGLMISSSIYYLSEYQRARSRGQNFEDALHEAQQHAVRTVALTHLVLIAEFLVLTASHFIPVIYFGIMASITVLGGLVGNLCMLPMLLRWVEGRNPPPLPPTAV